jgi:Ca-activated chloride channel homolog
MKFLRSFLVSLCVLALLFGPQLRQASLTKPVYAQEKQKPPAKKRPGPPTKTDQEDRPQGNTGLSVSVNLVSMNVLVTDPRGNVISGLQPENFKVYEDNVEQEITHFDTVEANLTVVMLVEFSRWVSPFIYEVWNAIYGFANSLRPGDWVAVIGYDIRPEILCDFTQNRSELMDALRRFNTPAFSESNLSDALIDTLDRVEETEGKVAVLLIGSGLDTFSKHTYDEALAKCKAANAAVYSLGLGQNFRLRYEQYLPTELNMDFLMADNRLKTFAEYTGGDSYFPRFITEFPTIFSNISASLRNQYSIAYSSSNTKKDGKYRKIRVDVQTNLLDKGKPMKLKIQTRKGYLAKEG